jgi:hypothetical protein
MPTFTIMGSGIGYSGGNYKNEQPGQAAKKAGKALFKKLTLRKFAKYKNRPSIKFVLRMRDRHSAGKTYSYMVTRIKLPKPLLIKKGDIEYEVKFDYKIETCNLTTVEVKTMTGGEYALVGGKLTCTGMKKKTGGNTEEGYVEEPKKEEEESEEPEEEPEEPEELEEPEEPEDSDDSEELEKPVESEKITGGKSKKKVKKVKKVGGEEMETEITGGKSKKRVKKVGGEEMETEITGGKSKKQVKKVGGEEMETEITGGKSNKKKVAKSPKKDSSSLSSAMKKLKLNKH